MDQEAEGVHALIGADLAKRHGENPKVVHAIAAHHEDVPPENILAVLVQAADTLSGARPGARREMLETYVRRLEDLEKVALSFSGISKSYAIQAGREIRLIVESEKVSDEEAALLSRDVAKKIEQDLTYPGQVKVTVIVKITICCPVAEGWCCEPQFCSPIPEYQGTIIMKCIVTYWL